jgi:cyclophilin family peptidyl-prolyl cis-trans isomerase
MSMVAAGAYFVFVPQNAPPDNGNNGGGGGGDTVVAVTTNHGSFRIALYPDKAPRTVANFMDHVTPGHYDNTLIHRVVRGFILQGGDLTSKGITPSSVRWEDTGLLNKKYTISMARGGSVDSGSSQFFINLADNPTLDTPPKQAGDGCPQEYTHCPYVVFGEVIEGFPVVDAIGVVPTTTGEGCASPTESCVPLSPVNVISIRRE